MGTVLESAAILCCVVGVNSTGRDEIQFTLKDAGGRRRRRHLEVTMATVNVLLGPRVTSHSRRSLGALLWKLFLPKNWSSHGRYNSRFSWLPDTSDILIIKIILVLVLVIVTTI